MYLDRVFLASGVLLMGAAPLAQAQSISHILVAERIDELCTDASSGRRLVSPERLASAMVDEANVPFTLRDRANPERVASNSVSLDEEVFLARGVDKIQPATLMEEQALERLSELRQALGEYLRGDPGDIDPKVYGRIPVPDAPQAKTAVEALFNVPAALLISCTVPEAVEPPKPAAWDFRLRGKVEDLRIPADDDKDTLSKVSAGTVSFQSDDVSGTGTFDVNLVAGINFDLTPEKGRYILGLLPYAQYERRETTGDGDNSGDKDKVAAGVLANFFTFGETWAVTAGLYPQYLSDLELDSEQVSATAFLVPDFALDLSDSYRFYTGAYNYVGSTLRIKPELKLVATTSYVLDEGNNPDLADHDDFYGVGGEAKVSIRFDEATPVLARLTIGLSYRWLDLYSTSKDNLGRFEAILSYDLFGTENIVAELAYVDGEDMDTQQDEEFWRLALGLKF